MLKPRTHLMPVRRDDAAAAGLETHERLVEALRLRYQPIVRLAGGHTESVEVLARSVDSDGAIGGPETIVAAMTGAEISMALTGAILQTALAELTSYGLESLGFACNLPLDAMLHPDLIVIIETIRVQYRFPPQKIRFELTERHPVEDIGTVAGIIAVLREAGYLIALDDITPGMQSLPALLNLPLHALKLDSSIVNSGTRADNAFIRKLATHAKGSRQQLIAEGIETPRTARRMRRLGATHGQGYLFAHPLPAAALAAFLRQPPR